MGAALAFLIAAQRPGLHPRRDCVENPFANQETTKRVWPPLTSRASGVGWKPLLGAIFLVCFVV